MAKPYTIERIYPTAPHALFGACLAALGRMHARIEQHDAERGVITAVVGRGFLAPISELTLQITPAGEGQARLVANTRPRRHGGDRRALPLLIQQIDDLLALTG